MTLLSDGIEFCLNIVNFLLLSGDEKRNAQKDTYNYYLSQCRIRIEMSFGLLCSKVRILQRPIQVGLNGAGKLFLCCTRLHNFAINERLDRSGTFDILEETTRTEFEEAVDSCIPSDVNVASLPGNSILRDILLQLITDRALVRPTHNTIRNNNNNI